MTCLPRNDTEYINFFEGNILYLHNFTHHFSTQNRLKMLKSVRIGIQSDVRIGLKVKSSVSSYILIEAFSDHQNRMKQILLVLFPNVLTRLKCTSNFKDRAEKTSTLLGIEAGTSAVYKPSMTPTRLQRLNLVQKQFCNIFSVGVGQSAMTLFWRSQSLSLMV